MVSRYSNKKSWHDKRMSKELEVTNILRDSVVRNRSEEWLLPGF